MFDPKYIEKHGIVTSRVPLAEIHGQYRDPNFVEEYEDIIIQTTTMSMAEWIDCAVYSWNIQLKYVFGIEHIPDWVYDYFYRIAVGVTKGTCRAQYDPGFGNIYWEPEEMAFLMISVANGDIEEDPKEFARKNVLWGRKSKVHGKKKLEPQDVIDRRPQVSQVLAAALGMK